MTKQLTFRIHAIQRMAERGISVDDIREIIEHGIVIMQYYDDTPYPSYLIMGWCNKRPLHVVAAENTPDNETIIITAYEPNPLQWEPDFQRRRR